MSGGVAYLLDPGADLERFCNTEMVLLETPTTEDLDLIRQDLRRHLHYTGSRKALDLLNEWDSAVERFVRVMPKEYKRVLVERAAKAEQVTVAV